MHRHWLLNKTNPEFIKYLSGRASISPLLAQLLVNREIKAPESISKFLNPSIGDLHDPFLLQDMHKAVERLKAAAQDKEIIFVHGDYDADGTTATALLVGAFRKMGLETHYHIPNRMTEGYGVSDKGIQKAKACGAGLIITADCGISSSSEIGNARSLGMDVIVTDHHEPPPSLPDAIAIINPHRKDSVYPFKYLSGVGVAFKLIQAVVRDMGIHKIRCEELFDLVAIGTIADSVPLVDENRVFAVYGLKQINNDSCSAGMKALKKAAAIEKKMGSGQLAFTLIPRINAAGRLDDAAEAVELFLTHDEERAGLIANRLEEQNRRRQKIEGEVLQSALDMIDRCRLDNALVLSSHNWHPGVIGIVASRLVEMFYRPVFLFSVRDSIAKGSARGIPPFHLYNAVAECSDLLIGFGGHKQAAGLKITAQNFQRFREQMNRIVERDLSPEDMVPVLEIDAAVSFSDLSAELVNELSLLEPFGVANREPLFGAKKVAVVTHRTVRENHLKMLLRQGSIQIDTIGFNMAGQMAKIGTKSPLDIAFIPSMNEWNGSKNIQLHIKGMRPSLTHIF
ncbi:MAG: single-stranded-DNA-specific exonuclease RecJ [Nitrospiraceae bacterium]|nr:MAG: single-stranded-DNA-specific exonuclease RecJ [Nitrospiraceae bacterium]